VYGYTLNNTLNGFKLNNQLNTFSQILNDTTNYIEKILRAFEFTIATTTPSETFEIKTDETDLNHNNTTKIII
jgi:hypothetical protein